MAMFKILLATFISVACGLKLKLLEPTEKTMWTTGTDVELFWKIDGGNEDKNIKTIEFNLMQGRSKRPELVDNIVFGVEWNHGDTFWTVKDKLPTGDDYFVRIISPEDKDFVYDSPFFTIKNSRKGKKAAGCSAASFKASPSKLVGAALGILASLALL